MKLLPVILFMALTLSLPAQTVVTPYQALHPLTKQNPNAFPNRPGAPQTSPSQPQRQAPAVMVPAKPEVIIAKIDDGLAASKISLIGRVDGLKGTLYVTNTGAQSVTATAQFAFCDQGGYKIGTASKTTAALAPNASAKIDVIATNLSTVDVKLMKLSVNR